MDKVHFFTTLADIIESNQTHTLSFELRKLNSEEKRELESDLRNFAEANKKES